MVAGCELGIVRAYTLESSLGGGGGLQYTTADYAALGHSMCAVTMRALGPDRAQWDEVSVAPWAHTDMHARKGHGVYVQACWACTGSFLSLHLLIVWVLC